MQPRGAKGLRQFLSAEQQCDWLEGNIALPDADERTESLEQRFKYVARFEKLLRRPQAEEVLAILRLYAERCIPIPRMDRALLLVGLLPSFDLRQAARPGQCELDGVLHALPDGEDIRARFIVHLSDFTTDRSTVREEIDEEFLHQCVETPIEVGFSTSGADLVVIKIRGSASIRQFLADDRALRGIRDVQSHPHESGPERLPGEPLLQRGRPYAGRLSVPTLAPSRPLRLHSGSTPVVRHHHWRGLMASSVPTAQDSASYEDRRAYPRVEVALPAFLQFNGERHAVQLLDLSPGGAKLDCATNLSTGTAVVLDCGTLGRAAVVRWKSAGVLGICFDSELDAREVSALINRSNALAARMKTRD